VPKGEVISASPAGPTSLSAGTVVSFTVSSGKLVERKSAAKR
jgi:beta-lactam-binding protein with PASTA domain